MSYHEEKNSSHNDDEGNEEPANRPDENEENNNQNEENNNQNEENNNENEINNNENGNENGNGNDRLLHAHDPFYYFEKAGGNCEVFSLDKNNLGNDDYKYCMCILLEDDSIESSQKLFTTLTGLKNSLKPLADNLEIIPQEICLFIFVKRTLNNKLFDDSEKENLDEKNKNFLIKEKTMEEKSDLKNIKMYIITNLNGLYEIRALKCYYSILKKLSKDKNMIFSTIITAGIIPVKDSLLSLIKTAYNKKKNHGIAVAPIEYTPNNLYSKIALYEKIHFNIFNMSLYDQSCSVPISSLFCTMVINKKLLECLENYYKTIPENATIDYHDYNLSLQLSKEEKLKYVIKFNYEKALGMIKPDNMTFLDYQKEWTERHSGYYGNFFEVLRTFINCNNFNFLQKIFMFFQIIAIIIEFILPSLACMVIYTVFYECFNTYDYRVAMLFTLLYLCMMFSSGVCSLITKEPKKMEMTNYFIYYFMILFYALVLVCSIPAMHFVNKNKPPDLISNYKFNKAACALLIILNFIFYIIPFIMRISVITPNIVSMFIYLALGATCSTTNFNMGKIWNSPETSGGNFIAEKKSICILIYLCFNLFFGSLSFYNVDRKKRVNCVMGFGILFLIYNFFRMLAIVFKKLSEKPSDDKIINEDIKSDLVKPANEEDIRSEEQQINKNDNDNDNDNENNDNENQNNDNENDNENQNENNEEQDNENNDNENNNENNNSNNENSGDIREVEVSQNE